MSDFSVGGAKIGANSQENQIQSITLCNNYVFFNKCCTQRTIRPGAKSWGTFENFCVKSNLTVGLCKATFKF